MPEYKFITVEKKGEGVAQVTINRPDVLNALNVDVLKELECAFYELEQGGDVKVVVLTGAGEKAFVAGADIAYMKDLGPTGAENFAELGQKLTRFMERSPLIFIAAVNGYALGGGMELAMACDIIIADEKAQLGQPEINLGIIPGFGGTQRLARLAGTKAALELVLSGRRIKAEEARELGIVNRVTETGKCLEEALNLAREIASKPAPALKRAKASILEGTDSTLEAGLASERRNFALLFDTHDAKEGLTAFVEKRKPQFRNM